MTPHFTLAELTASAKAKSLKLDNTPSPVALANLQRTAALLEAIRATLCVPITVTSAYRSQAVNRAVGGVSSSDHTLGSAADFVAPLYGTPHDIAKHLAPLVSTLGIGQLIYERFGNSAWVHVSTVKPLQAANRVITMSSAGAELGIQAVA